MTRQSILTRLRDRPLGPEPPQEPIRARLYVDGTLISDTIDVDRALQTAAAGQDTVALITGDRPDTEAVTALGAALGWEHSLLRRVNESGQRPKLEQHGDSVFVALRAALYVDEQEDILFSEFHVVLTGRVFVVLRSDVENASAWNTRSVDMTSDVLGHGPVGFLAGVIGRVLDLYGPVVDGVSIDVEQIERQVFGGDDAAPARIYRLGREVVDFQQAAAPMTDVVGLLTRDEPIGAVTQSVHDEFLAMLDRLVRVTDSINTLRDRLDRILSLNGTLVAQRQNEDMKRISSWAAILFAPTVITGIYGMNFHDMPELAWPLGYPLAVAAMVVLGAALWLIFKRHGWL